MAQGEGTALALSAARHPHGRQQAAEKGAGVGDLAVIRLAAGETDGVGDARVGLADRGSVQLCEL